ncbi:MAG: hypothetical protein HQ582_27880, partial [Planctomycetes bacterium]|nr:hypothetical protein [Planctomycetota bacterium]
MSPRLGSKSGQDLSPTKRRVFKVLTVILSLLACLACLEIGLRLFGPEYLQFSNLSKFYYSNPRGYFDVAGKEGDRVVYTVPVYGAGKPARRYPESLEADADIRAFLAREDTILGLGDSFTVGRGVRYEHTYLRRLEKMLAEDGKPVTIRNTGSNGYDVEHVRAVYYVHSAQKKYPLVLYGFVLNDFGLPGADEIVGSDYIDINNGGYQYNVWRSRCASLNFVCHLIDRIRLDRITRKAYLDAFRGQSAAENFETLRGLNRWVEADGG